MHLPVSTKHFADGDDARSEVCGEGGLAFSKPIRAERSRHLASAFWGRLRRETVRRELWTHKERSYGSRACRVGRRQSGEGAGLGLLETKKRPPKIPVAAASSEFCGQSNFAKCLKRGGDGAPGAIRTPDPQIRSLVLYPAEPRVRMPQKPRSNTPSRRAGQRISMAPPLRKR